jgi:hypothetical protein
LRASLTPMFPLRPALAAALLAAGALPGAPAAAQAPPHPEPTARPVLCPVLSGLEVGQPRSAAYQSMWRGNPERPVLGRDVSLLYTPRERRYSVLVTFDGAAPEARIAALHYVFDPPPGLLASLRERYGPEAPDAGDPAVHRWDVPSCGVRIRYRVQLSEGKRPLLEELWIDPLVEKPAKAPGRRIP